MAPVDVETSGVCKTPKFCTRRWIGPGIRVYLLPPVNEVVKVMFPVVYVCQSFTIQVHPLYCPPPPTTQGYPLALLHPSSSGTPLPRHVEHGPHCWALLPPLIYSNLFTMKLVLSASGRLAFDWNTFLKQFLHPAECYMIKLDSDLDFHCISIVA